MEIFGSDGMHVGDRSASARSPLDTLNGRSADSALGSLAGVCPGYGGLDCRTDCRESSSTSDAARYVIWITFLIVVCALTLFANLEGRDLWGADEARHAERAREMMASRQWMTPTYLGQPDFDKPPVHYWCGRSSRR